MISQYTRANYGDHFSLINLNAMLATPIKERESLEADVADCVVALHGDSSKDLEPRLCRLDCQLAECLDCGPSPDFFDGPPWTVDWTGLDFLSEPHQKLRRCGKGFLHRQYFE